MNIGFDFPNFLFFYSIFCLLTDMGFIYKLLNMLQEYYPNLYFHLQTAQLTMTLGTLDDGVHSIKPDDGEPFDAYCDMQNGAWMVFQRHTDSSVDFNRGWANYVAGFGDPTGNL